MLPETLSEAGDPDAPPPERHVPARWLAEWRGLCLFWAVALGVLAVVGMTLQVLGPPLAAPAARVAVALPHPDVVAPPGRTDSGPIAPPNPALLERAPADKSPAGAPADA